MPIFRILDSGFDEFQISDTRILISSEFWIERRTTCRLQKAGGPLGAGSFSRSSAVALPSGRMAAVAGVESGGYPRTPAAACQAPAYEARVARTKSKTPTTAPLMPARPPTVATARLMSTSMMAYSVVVTPRSSETDKRSLFQKSLWSLFMIVLPAMN